MAYAIGTYSYQRSSYSSPKTTTPPKISTPTVSKASTPTPAPKPSTPATTPKPSTPTPKPSTPTLPSSLQNAPSYVQDAYKKSQSSPAAVYTPSPAPSKPVTYTPPKPQTKYQQVATNNKQAAETSKNLPSVSFDAKAYTSPSNAYGETLSAANTSKNVGGYMSEGFSVQKVGDYAIIKGAGSNTALEEGIKGTKYAVKNADKYTDVFKFVDSSIAVKDALNPKTIGGKLGYAGIAVDAGFDTYNNIKNHAEGTKIAADAVVDVGFGLGAVATGAAVGAAVGSVVPVAGTAVGAVVGAIAGLGYTAITEGIKFNGQSVKDMAKGAVKSLLDKVF